MGRFGILVVSEHDIVASSDDFARNLFRIATQYLNLHAVYGCSARHWYAVFVVAVCDEWRTLGGAITHGYWEVDGMKECLNLLVEGCSSHDNLVEVASEGCLHLLAYLLLYHLTDDWHVHQQADTVGLYYREDALADNLVDDEWYCHNETWLHFGEGFGDERRTWQSGEEE